VTGSEVPLPDGNARQRIEADLACRLAVDAGAGSGKTRSLIERVVSIVATGHISMASIAAITFTEAAAAELRTRLRTTLAARAPSVPRLAKAAREVDDAAICTIHAFARRILAEHWLDAGLPPRFEVLDPAGADLDHHLRWRGFLDLVAQDPEGARMLARALAAGLRPSQLSPIAQLMADHHDRLTEAALAALANEREQAALLDLDVAPVAAKLNAAFDHLDECRDPDDLLYQHLKRVVGPAGERLGVLVGSTDEVEVIGALCDLGPFSCHNGRQSNWPDIKAVRDQCDQAEQLRRQTLDCVRQSVVADLGWRLAHWVRNTAGERRREGRLTYHDLLVAAVELLGSDPEVRRAVRASYRCILIDEFQDTDPLQAELARLLTDGEPDDGLARLFVVGDPNQSIYRFRRAEVQLFESAAAEMDDRVALTANFRSVPEILEFIDALFSELATKAAAPGTPPLHPVRPRLLGVGPPVTVLGGAETAASARELRTASSARVAQAVHRVVREGWTVEEAETRPARYKDIAVLMPTRTGLPALERAFEAAGVPYRLEGATLIWDSQEVRDLLAVLRAADDPADPVAVVAALRTPALACGDDDLVRHRQAGGSWDPFAPASGGGVEPVLRALGVLAALHERSRWLEPSALIVSVIEELHLFELALVHPRPRDHWHRLRWVLDQSRAFDESLGGTLGDFLHWVEVHEQADSWNASPGPPDPDDDAVRVMTIHGAKGLEFPIVVVTGLDTQPNATLPPVLFDRDGRPRFRFSSRFCSPNYEELKTAEVQLDHAERIRLLYVALTRARDHLLVDLSHRPATSTDPSRMSMAALLAPCCPIEAAAFSTSICDSPPTPAVQPQTPAPAAERWWAGHRQWEERRAALLAASAHQPACSATELGAAAARAEPGRPTAAAARPTTSGNPELQRQIGRAVHEALAKVDFNPDGALSPAAAELARAAARAHHLEGELVELTVALVGQALASPSVRALAARRHWKELPLVAAVEHPSGVTVVEGFADLVGETENGLVVIDFKTSADPESNPEYLGQVAAYVYALRLATGRPVTQAVISHLDAGSTTEEVLEGEALERWVRRVLMAAGGPPGSADATATGQLPLFEVP
jgi:ATP-dependent helicase/nuclease subunit A